MDNVKYCGYCSYHYKKLVCSIHSGFPSVLNCCMRPGPVFHFKFYFHVGFKQKKDSHIKVIPAFKPIQAENLTPEPTPEKPVLSKGDKVAKGVSITHSMLVDESLVSFEASLMIPLV